MPQQKSGYNWEMNVDGNVLTVRFHDPSAFKKEVEEINQSFLSLLEEPGVNAAVTCLDMEGAAGDAMLKGAAKAAEKGLERGLERLAVVADGIKQLAVKNKVDLPDLEVLTTEDEAEAVSWAREA